MRGMMYISGVMMWLLVMGANAAAVDVTSATLRADQAKRITLARGAAVAADGPRERAETNAELGNLLESYVLNGFVDSEAEKLGMYREMYDAFVLAADPRVHMIYGYTAKLAEAAVMLGDVSRLRAFFDPFLASDIQAQYRYTGLIDYAFGLERLGYEEEADSLYREAVAMRNPEEGREARFRYREFLRTTGRMAAPFVFDDGMNAADVTEGAGVQTR